MTNARTTLVTNTVQRPGTNSPWEGLSVSIRPNVLCFIDGGAVEKVGTRFATTDANGVWSCELEVNADIDPAGTYWTVHEGKVAQWSIVVPPAGSPVNLRDILVVDPANPSPLVAGVPLPGSGVPAGDVWTTDGLGGGDYAPPAGGGGDVQTVAGVSPDGTGNVPLTAADVGAATAGALTAEAATARAAESANATAIANETTRATGVEAAKADLVAGKVPTSQLPALSINEVFPVASQAAMLALTAQRGDIARRTDFTPNHLFLLTTDSPATLGDWLLIVSDPGAGVDTVNGQSGVVVLSAANVGADVAGAAATAQSAAIASASSDATTKANAAQAAAIAAAATDATTKANAAQATSLQKASNLSDVASASTSRTNLGLGNVDNTSDANKPVSTAQAAADALAAPKTTATIDLVDRTDNTTETVPAGTTTNCSTAGVTKTAPALAGSVGTPPLRWAVKNLAAASITVSYPDQAGAAQSLTVLSGETRTFRQKSTLGWGVESGAVALSTLDARYVNDSLVTAKGDIIAATGSGAPARVAVGADGQVLTADNASTAGVKWAAGPGIPTLGRRRAGRIYGAARSTAGNGATAYANGTLVAQPFPVAVACTIAKIGLGLTTAGSAGSVVRLGIYNDDGAGGIGTLLVDAGTILGTSANSHQVITINQAVAAGLYWVVTVSQGAPTTNPTYQTAQTVPFPAEFIGVDTADKIHNGTQYGALASAAGAVTGALPSPFPAIASGGAIANLPTVSLEIS